jgi:hypothetical protein
MSILRVQLALVVALCCDISVMGENAHRSGFSLEELSAAGAGADDLVAAVINNGVAVVGQQSLGDTVDIDRLLSGAGAGAGATAGAGFFSAGLSQPTTANENVMTKSRDRMIAKTFFIDLSPPFKNFYKWAQISIALFDM